MRFILLFAIIYIVRVEYLKGVIEMVVLFDVITGGYDVSQFIGGSKYRVFKPCKNSPVIMTKDGKKMKNLTARFATLIKAGQRALKENER